MGAHDTPLGGGSPDPSDDWNASEIDWETLPLDHPAWDILDDDLDIDLDDDTPPGIPPDPSQRTWRHPSEIAAANAHMDRANLDDAKRMHPTALGAAFRDTTLVQHPTRNNRLLIGVAAGALVVAAFSMQSFGGADSTVTQTLQEVGLPNPTVEGDLGSILGSAVASSTLPSDSTGPVAEQDLTADETGDSPRPYESVLLNAVKPPPAYAFEVLSGADLALASTLGTAIRLDGMEADLLVTSATAVAGLKVVTLASYEPGNDRPTLLRATVLSEDAATDIAVLRLEESDSSATFAPLGSQGAGTVGTAVQIRAGLPHGRYSGKVLSADDSEIATSVPVPEGHMGSALVNESGRVVGLVVYDDSRLARAIPSDTCLTVARNLAQFGYPSPNWLGMTVTSAEGMVEVVSTVPEGPAHRAGVLVGDRLVGAAGMIMTEPQQLGDAVAAAEMGELIDVIIQRNEDIVSLAVTVGQRPATEDSADQVDT